VTDVEWVSWAHFDDDPLYQLDALTLEEHGGDHPLVLATPQRSDPLRRDVGKVIHD